VRPDTSGQHPPRLELRRLVLADNPPVDLTVAAGEVVAISGWDSSDLLWAIAGLGSLASGEILIDGRRTDDHDQALAAGVALISKSSALATLLTAFENVFLPLAERRGTPDQSQVRYGPGEDPATIARQALTAVGLFESADHLIEDLSGGQQQRVAVARAIAVRPRLLLADQATTNLDAGNRVRVISLLRELAAGGAAVLLASDDSAIIGASDSTVVLESARPVAKP
jgi:putative ABC transport system ATP-binding protein